jgi:hypothetical protein
MFLEVRMSLILHFIFICDQFTDFPHILFIRQSTADKNSTFENFLCALCFLILVKYCKLCYFTGLTMERDFCCTYMTGILKLSPYKTDIPVSDEVAY